MKKMLVVLIALAVLPSSFTNYSTVYAAPGCLDFPFTNGATVDADVLTAATYTAYVNSYLCVNLVERTGKSNATLYINNPTGYGVRVYPLVTLYGNNYTLRPAVTWYHNGFDGLLGSYGDNLTNTPDYARVQDLTLNGSSDAGNSNMLTSYGLIANARLEVSNVHIVYARCVGLGIIGPYARINNVWIQNNGIDPYAAGECAQPDFFPAPKNPTGRLVGGTGGIYMMYNSNVQPNGYYLYPSLNHVWVEHNSGTGIDVNQVSGGTLNDVHTLDNHLNFELSLYGSRDWSITNSSFNTAAGNYNYRTSNLHYEADAHPACNPRTHTVAVLICSDNYNTTINVTGISMSNVSAVAYYGVVLTGSVGLQPLPHGNSSTNVQVFGTYGGCADLSPAGTNVWTWINGATTYTDSCYGDNGTTRTRVPVNHSGIN